MSRIGKLPINIPTGVNITVDKANNVTVKGPKGQLSQTVDPDIEVKIENNIITVNRPSDEKRHRSMHGLYRALIFNMVEGVTNGYKCTLELVGVGYRADCKEQILELSLGFSHSILLQLPKEISVTTQTDRKSNPKINLESIDKQLIGQVAAKIRSFRKPEPYKGKGVRLLGEVVRRKAGKSAGKGK
jgi:large subunit ribosomal protein L6